MSEQSVAPEAVEEQRRLEVELREIATNIHGAACALVKYETGDHPCNSDLEPSMLYMLSDLLVAQGDRLRQLSDKSEAGSIGAA
jgi:hypothetical protein